MAFEAAEELKRDLASAGYHPHSRATCIHPKKSHAVVTRPHAGSGRPHVTLAPLDTRGRITPGDLQKLKDHGARLDALDGPVDIVRVARTVYDEVRKRLGIADDPGFAFDPHDFRSQRPGVVVRIACTPQESEPWPLHATFGIFDHTDPLPAVRRVAAAIASARRACETEARRQADAMRIVERVSAIILAHALRDPDKVCAALSAPAARPRITSAFNDAITTEQETLSTDVPDLPGVGVRVSAKLVWLVTRGAQPGQFSWNGTTFMTKDGVGLSDTLLTAIIGSRLDEIADHPWLRGIEAPIIRAASKGKGRRAQLALRTATDRIDIHEARETASRIIATYEHVPL